MTAKQAQARTQKSVIRKRRAAERAEDRAEQREREIEDRAIAAIPTFYIPEVERNIKAAIKRGERSIRFGLNGHPDYRLNRKIISAIKAFGYKVEPDGEYHEADSGDPDSGEGRCDAGWKYWLNISW